MDVCTDSAKLGTGDMIEFASGNAEMEEVNMSADLVAMDGDAVAEAELNGASDAPVRSENANEDDGKATDENVVARKLIKVDKVGAKLDV